MDKCCWCRICPSSIPVSEQTFQRRWTSKMHAKSGNSEFTVGLFGIGLDTYWPQFEGLKERLEGYVDRVARQLQNPGTTVVNLGLVDSPEKAFEAGHEFRRRDVDLILLYVTTYALSSTVLPVVRRAKVPVIILNLAPSSAIDYEWFNRLNDRTKMTGEWLAHCQACPVPEIANVFNRCHIPFFHVTGVLRCAARLSAGRVGAVGSNLGGLGRISREASSGVSRLLLSRHWKRRQRGNHSFNHIRNKLANGPRSSSRGRIRSEKCTGHEDHGLLRGWRVFHGVLRRRPQRRCDLDGPRRPSAYCDWGRENKGATSEGLSWQSRSGIICRDDGQARSRHAFVGCPNL